MKRESLYIAATPYQFLLSAGIAAFSDDSAEKYFVIISDFKDAEKFHSALMKWKYNPFSEILLLEGRYGKVGSDTLGRMRAIKRNLGKINSFLKDHMQFDAYLCNVDQPEAQLIGNVCKKSGGITYHIGGLGIYMGGYLKEPPYRKFIKKMIYGLWYENAESHANYAYIDKLMVLRPDLMQRDVGKEIIPIPEDIFVKLSDTGLMKNMLGEYRISENSEWDILVMAPNSKLAERIGFEKVKKLYERIISSFPDSKVLVKYHPREEMENFLGVKEKQNVNLFPRAIPSEVLCASAGKGKTAVSDLSTGLLIFKIINKDALSISMMKILGFDYAQTERLFRMGGVKIPETMEEFDSMIKR